MTVKPLECTVQIIECQLNTIPHNFRLHLTTDQAVKYCDVLQQSVFHFIPEYSKFVADLS